MTKRSDPLGGQPRDDSAPPSATELDSWAADGAALMITVGLAVMLLLGVTGAVRVLLAVAFVSYVPGRAVVTNWPAAQARSQVALPVVLSLSIVSLIAVAGLWTHAWAPLAQFCAEAAASVAAITVAMLRRARAGWVR